MGVLKLDLQFYSIAMQSKEFIFSHFYPLFNNKMHNEKIIAIIVFM